MTGLTNREFVAELPDDWIEKRADFLCFTARKTVEPKLMEPENVWHYSIPNVQEFGEAQLEPAASIDSSKILIERETLLVSKLNPRKKTICIATPGDDNPTVASSEFVAVQSDAIDRRYALYVWSSEKVTDRLSAIVQSVTRSHQRVNPADIMKLPWRWPDLDTQRRIAGYLDDKTARIDALIEKKRALLDRLAEKRQALIIRAVTRGLNPDAPLKDSGIDWLGKVPAHWEVWSLKRYLTESQYGISEALSEAGEVAILRMGNIQNLGIDLTELKFVDEVAPFLLLQEKDVLFNRTNSIDLVGKSAIYNGTYKGALSFASYLARFRFDARYLPEFANFVFGTEQLLEYARTMAFRAIGQANLNPTRFAEIAVPVPPVEEQQVIIDFLTPHGEQTEAATSQITASIEKLTEYRAALVTAAVTGKIKALLNQTLPLSLEGL